MHSPSALVGHIWMILLIGGLRAAITVGPSNTVALIGEAIKLSCSADQMIAYWYFSKNGVVADETPITSIGCTGVIAGFTDHYAVESIDGGKTCNLIVANITMAQAGVYKCTEFANNVLSILTVTDHSPNITNNNTTVAVEKENVVIDCVLNYNGSSASNPTLRPYFYWTNSTGHRVNSFSDSTTENMAVSQLAVTAGRQDIAAYTCHVYFILNSPIPPNYASNTPTVSSIAISRTIEVHYYPIITSMTSTVSTTDNCVYKQETLTCAADANPPAQYEWLDLSNNNAVFSGAIKSVSTGGRYQCKASNVVRSQTHDDTKIQNLTTCYSPYNLTIIGSNCPKNSCSCSCNGVNQSSVSLSCMASGFPVPTFHWWSNVPGMEDLGSDQTINVDIDGYYSCTASNVYGSQAHTATASILITNCQPHPTTTPSSTILRSTPVTSSDACSCEQITTTSKSNSVDIKLWAAIALGVLLFISLVTNGIQLILLIMNKRTKRDEYKRTRNILQPDITDLSSETQTPTTYEELRRPTENNLQLSTYEELRHKPATVTDKHQ